MTTQQGVREAACAYAESLVGLAYPSERYVAELYPHDAPSVARQMARVQSSCALMAMAILRHIGVRSPGLDEPYASHLGQAVSIVKAIAIRDRGWVDAAAWTPSVGIPTYGDIVLIGRQGSGTAWGRGPLSAFEHVMVVTGYDVPTGCVRSVDGGQPGIAERVRRLLPAPGSEAPTELWTGHVGYDLAADGRPARGRRVEGWVNLGALDVG